MKILELFSGYGTASFALKRLGIPYEIVGYSDIDKYANQCFEQNHNLEHKPISLGDVRNINPNELQDFDLLTAGFPCQSFSNAGKMLGELDARGTLFYEIIRIAEVKQPKYMLLENVKGLTAKKFKDTFSKILSELDRIGYNVYWKVLNSKDYGIPQSRARVWFVCFRKDLNIKYLCKTNEELLTFVSSAKTNFPKETNDAHNIIGGKAKYFSWPEPKELKIFIKDILESEVDKKYYLSPLLQERFRKYLEEKNRIVNLQPRQGKGIGGKGIISKNDGTSYCLDSNNCQGIVAMRSYPRTGTDDKNRSQNLESREDGCSNTLTNVQKDNLVITGFQAHQSIKTDGISNALPSAMGMGGGHNPIVYDRKGFDSRTKGFRESELSPTLSVKMGTGGNNVPMVMNTVTTAFGRSGHSSEELNMINKVANTLMSRDYKGVPGYKGVLEKQEFNVIGNIGQLRRLTPKECFRLMGFLNDEINLDGLSDTQKYKLAGNGQDVNMVTLIFKEMFK